MIKSGLEKDSLATLAHRKLVLPESLYAFNRFYRMILPSNQRIWEASLFDQIKMTKFWLGFDRSLH